MNDKIPLERVFLRMAADHSMFPRSVTDYGCRYLALLDYLRANIYKDIDAGLAANSSVSGLYTAHGAEHFDEVVHYAGSLLGIKSGEEFERVTLEPYELYLLLVAIRVHDAGNIYGREAHEKQCFSVLRSCGAASGDDDAEKKVVATIAQAHGGKTSSGSKDTIGDLPHEQHLGKFVVRSRLLASIVRFADEICESRGRAANYLLQHGQMPKHSEIFHKYASCITATVVRPEYRRIMVDYQVRLEDVTRSWGCAVEGPKMETYLIDEILDRLEKMDRERRYCNRFSREVYTVDAIRATIHVINDNHDIIKTIVVPELCDSGYPDESPGHLKQELKDFCGPNYWLKIATRSNTEALP